LNTSEIKKIFLNVVLESKGINPAFMNWTEAAILDAMDRYQFDVLKSETGEIATFICYQQSLDFTEILALGSLQKFQRRGYSERLLRQFLTNSSNASKLVTLEVHAGNDKAIGLYSKCGFKTVRIRKNYYSDGEDALVMDCSLTGLLIG
jgi:[ribosomal protein S18]-alanine N-acetyltransferase